MALQFLHLSVDEVQQRNDAIGSRLGSLYVLHLLTHDFFFLIFILKSHFKGKAGTTTKSVREWGEGGLTRSL